MVQEGGYPRDGVDEKEEEAVGIWGVVSGEGLFGVLIWEARAEEVDVDLVTEL